MLKQINIREGGVNIRGKISENGNNNKVKKMCFTPYFWGLTTKNNY